MGDEETAGKSKSESDGGRRFVRGSRGQQGVEAEARVRGG